MRAIDFSPRNYPKKSVFTRKSEKNFFEKIHVHFGRRTTLVPKRSLVSLNLTRDIHQVILPVFFKAIVTDSIGPCSYENTKIRVP